MWEAVKVSSAVVALSVAATMLSMGFAAFLDRVHTVAPTMTTKAIPEMVWLSELKLIGNEVRNKPEVWKISYSQM